MKIIDLLNKIANGEEVPKKFKYEGLIITRDKIGDYYDDDNDMFTDSILADFSNLNDEIEIMEEDKKIEKIYHCCMESENQEIKFLIDNLNILSDKVNELIYEVNKLKEDK